MGFLGTLTVKVARTSPSSEKMVSLEVHSTVYCGRCRGVSERTHA